jgi:nitrate reductase cytochrome c-type subunit
MKSLIVAALASGLCISAAVAAPAAQAAESFTPAMIPHPVANYLPITPEKNMCVMCHKVGDGAQKKVAGVPSALPPSHVADGKVAPNRHECMLCHAEKTPAK